jgi:tetratricopeptide (TPR) repeat protein
LKTKDLPECLRVGDNRISTCLSTIEEEIKCLWDRPLLQHYTNHGMDHSQRIIEILGNVLEDFPKLLNDHERFILLASVFLHDIGMQSPRYADLPDKPEYTIEEKEKIRRVHHKASARMIDESISGELKLSLGIENCKEYAPFIALLSKYHRKLDIEEITDTSLAGKKIKLQFLTALLRLADALDADYRRVNMKILALREIPVESKYHWWFHYYVQSILVENGHIKIYFRFPGEYREDRIVDVFRNKVENSVSDALHEVYDVLYGHRIKLHPRIERGEEIYVSKGLIELVPHDLLKYIQENVLEIIERSEKESTRTDIVWPVDGVPYSEDSGVIKCLSIVFRLINERRISEAVREIDRCRILTMAPKEKMIFLVIAGNCYYILGDFREGENCYKDALKISEKRELQGEYEEDVMLTRAATLKNMGSVYRQLGKPEEAARAFQDAIKVYEEILVINRESSDESKMAQLYNNVGLAYSKRGDWNNAIRYFKKSLEVSKQIDQQAKIISREIIEKEFPDELENFDSIFDFTSQKTREIESEEGEEFSRLERAKHPEIAVGYTQAIINVTTQILSDFTHQNIVTEDKIRRRIAGIFEDEDKRGGIPDISKYFTDLATKGN